MAQGWGMRKGGGVVTTCMAQGWGMRKEDRDPPAWLRGGVCGRGGGCDHLHGSGAGYAEGGGGCDPPAWLRGGVRGRGVVTHLHGSGAGYAEGGGGCDPPAWLRGGVCGRGGGL